jgi:hypothetical protein
VIFEDKLRYMRWERQQRLMKRAEEFMVAQGLPSPTKPIPLKLAIPLFWAASLEDEDYLQDLWAMLLVNSANADSGIDLKRAHIDILERLSPLEAKILERIYSLPFDQTQHKGVRTASLPESASMDDEKNPAREQPDEEVKLALANLARLGCLSFSRSWGGGELFASVNPTLMGKSFVEACTPRVSDKI